MTNLSNESAALSLLRANLVPGIASRIVRDVNGLDMHLLESGASHNRPVALLLHGFPELAFSWRKVILPLAQAGFHVIAPDQRGYGATSGFDPRFHGDLDQYRILSLVRDQLALLARLAIPKVQLLVGHDFGSLVAAAAALVRPDLFESVVLMSSPFPGPPPSPPMRPANDVHHELAQLARARKHYQWYFSGADAERDMLDCKQGLHDFLRGYYHYKSADWAGNRPHRLQSWSATELAKLPTYYVMDLHDDMAETVAPFMPAPDQIATNRWLPDNELAVYAASFRQTGLQAGLNWYRCMTSGINSVDLSLLSGRKIEVPAMFIAGLQDWGTFQNPGAFDRMQSNGCGRWIGSRLIEAAGHWVQQEQPERVVEVLLEFAGNTLGLINV
jgi:pimeloyl-ACP methyl ester carboxylesterase